MLLLVLALTVVFTAVVAYIDEHSGMPPAGKPEAAITCRYDVPAGIPLQQLHYYGSQLSPAPRPGMQAVCMLDERTDVVLGDSSVVDGWRVTVGWHSATLARDGETQALVPAWQDSSPVLANWLVARLGDAGTQNMAGNCLLGMGEAARPHLRRAAADNRRVRRPPCLTPSAGPRSGCWRCSMPAVAAIPPPRVDGRRAK